MRSRLGWIGWIDSRQPCAGGTRWGHWRTLGAGVRSVSAAAEGHPPGLASTHSRLGRRRRRRRQWTVQQDQRCRSRRELLKCWRERGSVTGGPALEAQCNHGCTSRWRTRQSTYTETRHNGRPGGRTAAQPTIPAGTPVGRSRTGWLAGWLADWAGVRGAPGEESQNSAARAWTHAVPHAPEPRGTSPVAWRPWRVAMCVLKRQSPPPPSHHAPQ